MLFTVLVNGFYHRCHCNCRDSVLFVGRRPFLRGPNVLRECCVAMSHGGGFFSPGGAYDSVWDSVKPIAGKYLIYYFQHHEDVGCVCMLNGWFSNNDDICADNFLFSQFKLKDKCRSEKWEVYLCGDMSIMVSVIVSKCCPGVCLRLALVVSASVLHPTWQRVTHHLWVVPAF